MVQPPLLSEIQIIIFTNYNRSTWALSDCLSLALLWIPLLVFGSPLPSFLHFLCSWSFHRFLPFIAVPECFVFVISLLLPWIASPKKFRRLCILIHPELYRPCVLFPSFRVLAHSSFLTFLNVFFLPELVLSSNPVLLAILPVFLRNCGICQECPEGRKWKT